MRKMMTGLLALALIVGFSGFALAGGSEYCSYSHTKAQAEVKTEKTKPVASTTDKTDNKVALADAEKTQPAAKK